MSGVTPLKRGTVSFRAHKEVFYFGYRLIALFPLDGVSVAGTHDLMGKNRARLKKWTTPLVAGGVALLFLVQTLVFVFSTNGRLAFSSGSAGASIVMAGEICHSKPEAGDKNPQQPIRHHNCALCSLGNCTHEADALVLTPAAVIILASLAEVGDTPEWFLSDSIPSLPVGWTSSWSSRAPPIV